MDMFILNERHRTTFKKKRRGQFKPDPGQSTTNNTNTNTSSTNVLGGGTSTMSTGTNSNSGSGSSSFRIGTYKDPNYYSDMKGRKFYINQGIRDLDPNDPDFEKDAREYHEYESQLTMNPKFYDAYKKNWEDLGRQDVLSIDEIIEEMKNGDPQCRQASIALHRAATSKDTGFITKVLAKLHVLARKYEVKYSNTKVNGPKTLFQKMIYYIGKAIRYLTARLYKFMHKNEAYVLNIGTLKQVVTE